MSLLVWYFLCFHFLQTLCFGDSLAYICNFVLCFFTVITGQIYNCSDVFIFYFVIFFSPYYWSDMFTVLVNISTSMQICEDWNRTDMTFQTIQHEDVTSCPCSVDVALLDLARFHIDPSCVEIELNIYDCYQHPFAKLCFKQNLPS